MTADRRPPRVRSALYVPGHRADFMAKVTRAGADAVIVDLEDAVPPAQKQLARDTARQWIAGPRQGEEALFVRINALEENCLAADLEVAVLQGVSTVLLPKTRSADEMQRLDDALSRAEEKAGLPVGAIWIWPLLESALAVRNGFDIAAASPRTAYMGGGGAASGDLARSLGCTFSGTFYETLYMRSKVLLDARAAGVANPIAGTLTNYKDTVLMESFARHVRGLGYEGMMAIHPSQVAIANRVFSPSEDELATARGVVDAMARAESAGNGAVEYKGGMVDYAMLRTAQDLLADFERFQHRGTAAQPA